jgi:hypothetical protein
MGSLRIVSLLIVAFAAVGFSQPVSTAVQVDEFFDVNCEFQRGVFDILLGELKDSPELYGVIVIHGTPDNPVLPYKQKFTIINHLKFRGFDTSRVHIRLGNSEPRFRTELWKSPPQDLKRFEEKPWDYKLTNLYRPILVHADSWIDGIGCGWFSPDLKFYSEFLLANNNLIGRVIVRDRSIRNYNRVRSRIIRELKSKYKVATNRLEFAYLKSDRSDVEYWYVPSDIFPPISMAGSNDLY